MEKLRCKCGSKRFVAIEEIVDIIDDEYNVLDSNYSQMHEPCYKKIWCYECGRLIKGEKNFSDLYVERKGKGNKRTRRKG